MRSLKLFSIKLIIVVVIPFLLRMKASAIVRQVSIADDFFSPLNTIINPGDTIRWTNNGVANHTSTSNTRVWSSGSLAPGQSYSRQFLVPGVYAYHCSIHVAFGMRDTIRVAATGVDDPQSSNPNIFKFAQNYPNPFNAQTMIQYTLLSQTQVSIDIFDILGRKIATVAEGMKPAGDHRATWDAISQSSGIYFYRIKAGDKAETRKMLLQK